MALSPFHLACRQGRVDTVKHHYAADSNTLLNQPTVNGWTCMHFAARSGSLLLIEYLISETLTDNGSVFGKNIGGQSCLGVAYIAGQVPIAKRLLVLLAEKRFEIVPKREVLEDAIVIGSKVTRDVATWAADELSNSRIFRSLVLFGMKGSHSGLAKLRNMHRAKRLIGEYVGHFCACEEGALERFAAICGNVAALSVIHSGGAAVIGRKAQGVWYSNGDECPKAYVGEDGALVSFSKNGADKKEKSRNKIQNQKAIQTVGERGVDAQEDSLLSVEDKVEVATEPLDETLDDIVVFRIPGGCVPPKGSRPDSIPDGDVSLKIENPAGEVKEERAIAFGH